jgi:hypothetical protein
MSNDIFDNLAALRLSPEAAAAIGTREVLSHVPVRKPNRHEFIRVHPDADMSLATFVFVDKDQQETFFVAPEMRDALVGEVRPVLLVVAITRQGTVLVWPVPLPDESGRRNTWAEAAREAAELAKTRWVRLVPDMGLGAYRIYKAEGTLSDPVWPGKTLKELLSIAFRDRIIDREDHPVVKRLRGLS